MNVLLQQLHSIVPAFNIASIPQDATGVFASPVHIIAELLSKNPGYITRQLNSSKIIANINGNCAQMKLSVNGEPVCNKIMAGDANAILRVLVSCNRPEIAAIIFKLPVLPQAPSNTFLREKLSRKLLAIDKNMAAKRACEEEDSLVLNGMSIEVDPVTLMVNATQICQAAGKCWKHYHNCDKTKNFLQILCSKAGIPAFDLVRTKPGHHGGTMVHRMVALNLARWCHEDIAVQFTMWIDELLLNGRVELGNEMNPEQLDAIWKRRIAEEQAKTQADDTKAFLREKHSRELLAIDENMAATRAREEEDRNDRAAKRQRDDAAAVDKAKEESRMQLVRFDADMAAMAKNLAEDLKLKRIECAKSLVEFKANYMPKLTDCLDPSLGSNAQLRSAMNDIEVNLVRKISKCVAGNSESESPGYQETQYCHDFQMFLREMNRPVATAAELSLLGRFVAKKYREKFKKEPETTEKYINGDNRPAKTYKIEHKDFIKNCIQVFCNSAASKKSRDLRAFFGAKK